jgi:hypothetical protein
MNRHCPKCKRDLPIELFGVSTRRRDGMSCWCKECNRNSVAKYRSTEIGAQSHRDQENARYASNPETARERSRKFHENNRELCNSQAKERGKILRKSEEFRLRERKRGYDWYQRNRAYAVSKVRQRQIGKLQAQPKWLTAIQKAQIKEFYEIAEARKMQTGIPHHVDHMFALRGKEFRGLHVPWNLQVLTRSANDSKGIKVPMEFAHHLWSDG